MTNSILQHAIPAHVRTASRLSAAAAFILAVACLGACGDNRAADGGPESSAAEEIPFRPDGQFQILRGDEVLADLEIEIAEDDSSRTRGMMQRTELPGDRGMLFIFPDEQDRGFWMANTPLSLDLIFIGADSTIVSIAKYMRPLSPQNVPSNGPAQYVLEVIAGNADTIGIVEGDRVTWEANPR